VSAERRLAAAAHDVFLVVTDPARHVEIDGSGMLRAAVDPRRLEAVGDTFDMEMDRQPLREFADLPRYYTVRNTVTRIVPDRLLEWAPAVLGEPATGRVYGWEIQAVGAAECKITNYCDWSGINDPSRAGRHPIVPVAMLEQSVAKLVRVAGRARSAP
jgi:hypothetical protein